MTVARLTRAVGVIVLALSSACQSKQRDSAQDSTIAEARYADARRSAADTRRRILFAGTSLTEGYGIGEDSAYSVMIQQKIDSVHLPFETVNAGLSGETTAGLLQRMDWLLTEEFDVIVIESGANDGLRGVEASAIRANLIKIIRRVQAERPKALILLVQMEALPNYGRRYGTAFHDAYASAARETKIGLLPFLLEGVAGRPELNQNDGLHPNVRGERIVAANVWRGLEPVLRERALQFTPTTK